MSTRTERISQRFIRGLWSRFHSEKDTSWIRRTAELPLEEHSVGGDLGPILRRMREQGVADADIARYTRIVQHNTLFDVLYYLDDFESDNEGPLDPNEQLEWHVALTTEDHELVDLLDVSYERLSDFAPRAEWLSLVPKNNPVSGG